MTEISSTAETSVVSFDAIFVAQSNFVWSTLRRLGVRAADLEDVTHEVFVTVYRRLGDYDTSRPIRPWLFGIAYRVALRYKDLARNAREILEEPAEVAGEDPPLDEQYEKAEQRHRLHAALNALPIDQRAVFLMHDAEGQAMPDVAESLGVPLNTAYSRLRLARAELKRKLGGGV